MHDLAHWAAVIAQTLKPGGFFYLVDSHPMLLTIDDKLLDDPQTVRLAHPYFEHANPLQFTGAGSYADRDLATQSNDTFEWMHSLSEILTSLIEAGLTIELFHEHRVCPWQALPCCTQASESLYRLPDNLVDRVPLLLSVKARKSIEHR